MKKFTLHNYFSRGTLAIFAGVLLTSTLFNIIWCCYTTFKPFSHPEMWISEIFLAVILTLPYVLTRRKWVGFAVIAAIAVMYVANLMYYRTYFTNIPLSSYLLAGNLRDFLPAVKASLQPVDALFLVLILVIGWRITILQPDTKVSYINGIIGWLGAFVVSGGVWLLYFKPVQQYIDTFYEFRNSCYLHASTPVMYSVAGTALYDFLKSSEPLDPITEAEANVFISRPGEFADIDMTGGKKRNLVFIFAESFESWPINLIVENQEITPNLNRIATSPGALFIPNVKTQVGAGRSMDSQLLNLAGLMPLTGGTFCTEFAGNEYLTIPKAMKEKYSTRNILLTSDKLKVWNQGQVAAQFGIDVMRSYPDWEMTDGFGTRKHIGDREFARQIIKWCNNPKNLPPDSSFFAQIVLYSGHAPFKIPDKFQELKFCSDKPEVLRDFLQAARYVDGALGMLTDYFMSRPDSAETTIVIAGDHEGLASDRSKLSDYKFVDQSPHTPLIIINPPARISGKIEREAGQIDVYPTLLNLLGLRDYRWKGLGRDILLPSDSTVSESNLHEVSDAIIRYNLLK